MEWRTLSSAIAINADKALSFNETSRHYDAVQFVVINVCLIFSHLQMPRSLNDSNMFYFPKLYPLIFTSKLNYCVYYIHDLIFRITGSMKAFSFIDAQSGKCLGIVLVPFSKGETQCIIHNIYYLHVLICDRYLAVLVK
jgi:hypothetical protein